MKKLFPPAALALAVAGSWAFYPKAPAESGGYMTFTASIESSLQYKIILTTVSPEGQIQAQSVPVTKNSLAMKELSQNEVIKLNQLRQAGWRVISATPLPAGMTYNAGSSSIGTTVYMTYLLEK